MSTVRNPVRTVSASASVPRSDTRTSYSSGLPGCHSLTLSGRSTTRHAYSSRGASSEGTETAVELTPPPAGLPSVSSRSTATVMP